MRNSSSKDRFNSVETVPPPKDEPTTAMPAEALDTSTNPPVEQEDANNEDGEEHDFYWNFDENDGKSHSSSVS